jgi:hypothetical protein
MTPEKYYIQYMVAYHWAQATLDGSRKAEQYAGGDLSIPTPNLKDLDQKQKGMQRRGYLNIARESRVHTPSTATFRIKTLEETKLFGILNSFEKQA